MDTTNGRTDQPLSDGVPVHVTDIAEARVRREQNRDRLRVTDWWLTAVLAPALAAALAGRSVAQAEESHRHQWVLGDTTSNECCVRFDLENGVDDDGNRTFIKRCGKRGVRLSMQYDCKCGAQKVEASICKATD